MADNFDIYMCMTSSANAEAATLLLQQAEMDFRSFETLPILIDAARENGLGALFLEEEQLRQGYGSLQAFLATQPPWSEPPVILITGTMYAETGRIFIEQLPNLTMLERPVSSASLLSHLQAAQKARKRQYQMRDLLFRLSRLNETLEEQVAGRTAETERRRIEAERSNEDLQHFASVISHDLREPLLVISRYLDLLAKQLGDKLDDNSRRFIEQSTASAHRMQNMISAILKYSRSDNAILNLERVDTGHIVEQACANLNIRIESTRAVITCDENMPTICGDKVLLTQLFQNLLSNGIKFAHMEPPQIHVCAEKDENQYRFAVSDNGIGINDEQYQKVFNIFDRASRGRKYSGFGIGLAVCKKIIERHGGSIWVESEMWQGSTFYFTIPDDMQCTADESKPSL